MAVRQIEFPGQETPLLQLQWVMVLNGGATTSDQFVGPKGKDKLQWVMVLNGGATGQLKITLSATGELQWVMVLNGGATSLPQSHCGTRVLVAVGGDAEWRCDLLRPIEYTRGSLHVAAGDGAQWRCDY